MGFMSIPVNLVLFLGESIGQQLSRLEVGEIGSGLYMITTQWFHKDVPVGPTLLPLWYRTLVPSPEILYPASQAAGLAAEVTSIPLAPEASSLFKQLD